MSMLVNPFFAATPPPDPGTARQFLAFGPMGPVFINADATGRAYLAAPGVAINEDDA